MTQIQYGGSWYLTLKLAAGAWAVDALPDTRVVGADEDADTVAQSLEAFWWREAREELPGGVAESGVSEEDWRSACREALVARIVAARA